MEQSVEYLLFGQIQDVKNRWYIENGSGLSFKAAVELLQAQGRAAFGVPEKPDFLSWNLTDMREFRRLINAIPIPVSEIREVEDRFQEDITYLTTRNEVQITLESCRTQESLISVDYFGVLYVLEGSGKLVTQHARRTMRPGELCILPPNFPYYVLTGPEDIVINVVSRRESFQQNFSRLLYRQNLVSDFFRRALFQHAEGCIFFMVPPTKDFKSILQHLFAEFVRKDEYSEALFYNYLRIFYANIIRSVQSTYDYYAFQKETTTKMVIPAILQFISANYRTLTLGALAERFHYDSTYLGKQLKAATGSSYSQLVTKLKIDQARQLLEQTNLRVETISEQVGYHSADHFTYAFKKNTSISPKEYRAKHRQGPSHE